jgi:hypothetical protein
MKNEIFILHKKLKKLELHDRRGEKKKINKYRKFAYVALSLPKTAVIPECIDLFHPFIKWNFRKKILHEVVKMNGELLLQGRLHFFE